MYNPNANPGTMQSSTNHMKSCLVETQVVNGIKYGALEMAVTQTDLVTIN